MKKSFRAFMNTAVFRAFFKAALAAAVFFAYIFAIWAGITVLLAVLGAIIIGRQGAMLRTIGSQAREDIEKLMGTKVLLKLWVKVREDWRNRESDLRATGYEE